MKLNYKNQKIQIFSLGLTLACMISTGIFVQSCSQEDDEIFTEVKLSKSEYEAIFKNEVDNLIAKAGPMGESFLMQQGLPIWENMQWVATNSQDMLMVPLLGTGENKKCIVGVVTQKTITPVIIELSAIDRSKNRIFSLDNRLLYDNGKLVTSIPRLKSDDECSAAQQAAENLLQNGGQVQSLYNAYYGSNSTYNANAYAGYLSINASSNGSASSFNADGHAWISYTNYCGNTTTFGTWGYNPFTGGTGAGYYVNAEKNYLGGDSYSVQITYNQFQALLNYNSQPGNKDWSIISNCSSYASGAWQAVTGEAVSGTLVQTPSGVQEWINNKKKK